MKTLQPGILVVLLAASWLVTWRIHRSAKVELQAKQETWRQTAAGLEQLSSGNQQLSNTLARLESSPPLRGAELEEAMKLRNEVRQLQQSVAEINMLRREIPRLRAGVQDIENNFVSVNLAATLADEMEFRRSRVARLQQWLDENPSERIPELQFVTELEWIRAVENPVVNTDDECRQTMSLLRHKGENAFSRMAFKALQQYAQANDGRFPATPTELKPYFTPPVDDTVLERYEVVAADSIASDLRARPSGGWIITQKAPVNRELDYRSIIGFNGPRPLTDAVRWSSPQ